jgi:hypothetical protein
MNNHYYYYYYYYYYHYLEWEYDIKHKNTDQVNIFNNNIFYRFLLYNMNSYIKYKQVTRLMIFGDDDTNTPTNSQYIV